jgi:lysophospholipase L1-like esterase
MYPFSISHTEGRMLKILAIGHSIVKGAGDGNEISVENAFPRPPSLFPAHLPEGGWNYGKFQIKPRWGDGSLGNEGGPGWVVRVADFLPPGTVQIFNEGYSGGTAGDWDPQGNDYIGKIFAREDEVLPRDLDLAVFAIMANDIKTAPQVWKEQVGRVIDVLEGKNIRTLLVHDWFHGEGTGPYFVGDCTAVYDALCAAVDELIVEKKLLPALDIRTISERDYKQGGATLCFDLKAWHTHPNTAGMIAAAQILADYLRQHVLPSGGVGAAV